MVLGTKMGWDWGKRRELGHWSGLKTTKEMSTIIKC